MNDSILLVDDAPETRSLLERSLRRRFRVSTAAGGQEALKLCAEQGPFAVVVTDQGMPDMTGLELLAHLRAKWPQTVPIMLTGQVNLEIAVRALHEGRILRFLEKPCRHEALCAALDDALAHYRRTAETLQRERELEFKHGALCDFNAVLSERIQEQAVALFALNRFVGELNSADSMSDIAMLAAYAVAGVVGGRACTVELYAPTHGGQSIFASAGDELGPDCHVEQLATQEGVLGRMRVCALDALGRKLTQPERDLLSSITASTSVAVHNQLRRAERDDAQQATILALARLAEKRDNETGKHLERVSLYCQLVAEGLRADGLHHGTITDEWVRDLVRSAPLHDIGKVGIPDSILLKPGKLTAEEWAIMKRHSEIGADTLRSVMLQNQNQRFLQMSLDIAWCHHEKWDGSGYPRGLAGPAIPLAARIVALADVYDALTSVRPYKEAWTHEKSLEWIVAGAGAHFDPDAVAAFAKRAHLTDPIRARLADTLEDIPRVWPELAARE